MKIQVEKTAGLLQRMIRFYYPEFTRTSTKISVKRF